MQHFDRSKNLIYSNIVIKRKLTFDPYAKVLVKGKHFTVAPTVM